MLKTVLVIFSGLKLRRQFFSGVVNSARDLSCSSAQRQTDNNQKINFIEKSIQNLRIYDEIDLSPAKLNWNYLLDKDNKEKIQINNLYRKGNGDIVKVVSYYLRFFKYKYIE